MGADGSIVIDVNLDRDGFKRQVGGMKGDAQSAFAGLRDAMMGPVAAAKMIAQAIGAVGNALGKLTNASGQVEKYKATLETMLGSQEAAVKRFKEMSDFAAKTPFELPDVVELGNRLQSIGKYSQEAMTDLGDLAAASGKPIEQVATAFAKLATGQRGEAVNMFRDLLISTNDWVTATGKGVTKSGELLATTEEMVAALPKILQAKGFSGMMDKQSKTWLGIVSNLNDAMFRLSVTFGDILTGPLKGIVKEISAGLDKMNNFVLTNVSLREEINGWSSIMLTAWNMLKQFTIDPELLRAIKEMSESFRNLAEVTIPLIGAAFTLQASSIGNVFKYIVNVLKWIADQISLYVTFYKSLFTGDFKKAIAAFILIIIGWAMNLVKFFETIVEGALKAIKKVADLANKFLPKQFEITVDTTLNFKLSNEMAKWQAAIEKWGGINQTEPPVGSPDSAPAPDAPREPGSLPAVKTAAEQKALDDRIALQEQWAAKLLDLQNDTLEEQRDFEIAEAEKIGADTAAIREYYAIKIAEHTLKVEEEAAEKAVEAQKEAAEKSKKAWDESFAQITGAFDAISQGISQLGGEQAKGLADTFGLVGDIIKAAAQGFQNIGADIQLVVSLLSLAGENMPTLFNDFVTALGEIGGSVMAALGPIFEVILSTITMLLPIFQPIIDLVAELARLVAPFIPIVGMIVQLVMAMIPFEYVMPIIAGAVELLADVFLWFYNGVLLPVYNWMILIFNKIYNGWATFLNGILAMIDAIPFVELSYRVALKKETAGQLAPISTDTAPEGEVAQDFTVDLDDANEKLQKNRDLFKLATNAAAAYDAVLSSVVDTVADFYDGLKSVGSDIADMIIDGISSGFDNDDFLFALEEYIVQSVIQAAVFTDAFMAQVASIGTQLAQAIASGDTNAIASLQAQLASLYEAAALTAQTVTASVADAFGSYAVGSLGLERDGLIYAHAGEGVIPAGLMREAAARGLTIAPSASLMSGAQQITINLRNALTVDGREIAAASFRYQDDLVRAAYGN